MKRVLLRNTRDPSKVRRATKAEARILIASGRWEPHIRAKQPAPARPPEPAPPPVEPATAPDELEDMAYWDLRALAKERGIEASGTKPEVIAAIRSAAGTYQRRDMRAEE